MNVAFVSDVVYPFVKGGAEKRIHEIGSRLARRGHTVTIYGRHWWDGPTTIHRDGMRLRAVSPARELYVGERRSIAEAIEFATDLLLPLRHHIHEHDVVIASVFPYFPVLTSKLSTLFRHTPLITTWHEVWDSYWNEYLGRLAPFGSAIERLTANIQQRPVAVSGVTADRLARIGPPRETIEVLHNGINVEKIRSVPPIDDGFDVLFAGRLIKDKNVDLLLRAFDHIASDHDVTLGIIGDGPEQDKLRTQTKTMNNSDRVTFLGFLDEYEDVIRHMHAAELFVSPSTREGFGITLAEAMAADCTVIAANHPDSAANEIVGNGGFVVEPSLSSLTDTLTHTLHGKRPLKSPVGVAQRYDWDAIVERAEQVYSDTIEHY